MKGLTHFASGVAAVTFIPEICRMSISSRMDVPGAASSFIIVLAGLYGIMPDTMDFKLGQFFEVPDFVVDPDPRDPDPQEMAQAFADAVKKADDTGKEVRIQFFPTQLGANKWRQYCIIFEETRVHVQLNDIVSTSQIPYPGTLPKGKRLGSAKLVAPLKPKSDVIDWLNAIVRYMRVKIKGPDRPKGNVKPSTVDILSSTMFGLKKEEDGKIFFNWLPWHRTWSHSYVFGAMLAAPILPIAYFMGLEKWWLYGLSAFIGVATHITEDMTGHIGGSLLWPLMKARSEGLELVKASDPRTNFSLIYGSLILTIWNLDRHTTHLAVGGPDSPMSSLMFLGLFLVLPLWIYLSVVRSVIFRLDKRKKEAAESEEEPDGMGDAIVD